MGHPCFFCCGPLAYCPGERYLAFVNNLLIFSSQMFMIYLQINSLKPLDSYSLLWYNKCVIKREVHTMYRLDRMRKEYEKHTAAQGYAIGFHIGEDVYCAMIDRIPRRYTKIQKECSKAGGGYGLCINVKKRKIKRKTN